MKTLRESKIKNWTGCFFEEMVNILDTDPECFIASDTKHCTDGTMLYNLCYSDKTGVSNIVFNNIDCIFKKGGTFSYLVFCVNDKNKPMTYNYGRIIEQLEDEIFSWFDEFEDDEFIFGGNFMRFRFKADDNLVYNEKINIPVCVISLSIVIKKEYIYCPVLKLQRCFYENESF